MIKLTDVFVCNDDGTTSRINLDTGLFYNTGKPICVPVQIPNYVTYIDEITTYHYEEKETRKIGYPCVYVQMHSKKFIGYTDKQVTAIIDYAITNQPENTTLGGLWFAPNTLLCYMNTRDPNLRCGIFGDDWVFEDGVWQKYIWDSEKNIIERGTCRYWRHPLTPSAIMQNGKINESLCLSPHRTIGFANFVCHMWSMMFDSRNWIDGKYGCCPPPPSNECWNIRAVNVDGFVKMLGHGDKSYNHVADHIMGDCAAFPQPSDMFGIRLTTEEINQFANIHKCIGCYDYDPLDWGRWRPWKYRHVDQRKCGLPTWCSERAAIKYAWFVEMIDRYNMFVHSGIMKPIWRNNITTHHPDGTPFKKYGDEKLKCRR